MDLATRPQILESPDVIINPYIFAAAGGANLLLDESGLGSALGAWSISRKLRSAYAGSCIRVRESGGDTEADIGFSGNGLDTAALASHCGSNDGFIVTIFDQSGNGNDATQSTAGSQPKIVNAGSLLTGSNGKPIARFDGADDYFTTPITGPGTAYSFFVVVKGTSLPTSILRYQSSYVTYAVFPYVSGGSTWGINHNDATFLELDAGAASATWQILSMRYTAATTNGKTSYVDGASQDVANTEAGSVSDDLNIGLLEFDMTEPFDGDLHEVITYHADVGDTAMFTGHGNLNTHYATY